MILPGFARPIVGHRPGGARIHAEHGLPRHFLAPHHMGVTADSGRSPLGRLLRDAGACTDPVLVRPHAQRPITLVVSAGRLLGIDCGGRTCVRGLGHDLQTLLIAAVVSATPTTSAVGSGDHGRPRVGRHIPVASAAAVCDAVAVAGADVPELWLDPHARVLLGAGPRHGDKVFLDDEEWAATRALLLGGLPAAAGARAWRAVAHVFDRRVATIAGSEDCPATTTSGTSRPTVVPAAPLAPLRRPGASLAASLRPGQPVGAPRDGDLTAELAQVRRKAALVTNSIPTEGGGRSAVDVETLRKVMERLQQL